MGEIQAELTGHINVLRYEGAQNIGGSKRKLIFHCPESAT